MAINLGDAILYAGADFSGMQKDVAQGMASVNQSIGSATTIAKSHFAGMAEAGRKVASGMSIVGGAIVGALGMATKGSAEFQKGMAEISTLGVKDLEKLKTGIEDVSMEYAVKLPDGIEAVYQALSKGVPEKDVISVLISSAKAAKAGVADLSTAVELGSGMINVFGGTVEEVFDSANVAVQGGALRFTDLNKDAGRVAPTFKALGWTADDLFTAIATLTSQNVECSESVTWLKAITNSLIQTQSEAGKADEKTIGEKTKLAEQVAALTQKYSDLDAKKAKLINSDGSLNASVQGVQEKVKKLNEQYAKLGIQRDKLISKQTELAKQNGAVGGSFNVAAAKAMGFEKWLKAITKETGGGIEGFSKLFKSTEAMNGMLALTSDKGGKKMIEMFQSMNGKAGLTNKTFETMKKNDPTFELINAANTIEVFAHNIGEILLPSLKSYSKEMVTWVRGIREYAKENKGQVEGYVKLAAVIGGVLLVARPLYATIETLIAGYKLFTIATTALADASGLSGLAGVFVPGGALILGLGAVAYSVWKVYEAYTAMTEAANGALEAKKQEPKAYTDIAGALNGLGIEYDHSYASSLSMGDALVYLQSVYTDHKNGINSTKEALVTANKKMREDQEKTGKSIGDGLTKSTGLWASWSRYVCGYMEDIGGWAIWLYEKLQALVGVQAGPNGGSIPAFASGGYVKGFSNHRTIFAGEEGPELATFPNGKRSILTAGMYNVPTGTHISTAAQTARMGARGGSRVNVNINLSGNLSKDADVARVSRQIARTIKTSLVGAV